MQLQVSSGAQFKFYFNFKRSQWDAVAVFCGCIKQGAVENFKSGSMHLINCFNWTFLGMHRQCSLKSQWRIFRYSEYGGTAKRFWSLQIQLGKRIPKQILPAQIPS